MVVGRVTRTTDTQLKVLVVKLIQMSALCGSCSSLIGFNPCPLKAVWIGGVAVGCWTCDH